MFLSSTLCSYMPCSGNVCQGSPEFMTDTLVFRSILDTQDHQMYCRTSKVIEKQKNINVESLSSVINANNATTLILSDLIFIVVKAMKDLFQVYNLLHYVKLHILVIFLLPFFPTLQELSNKR